MKIRDLKPGMEVAVKTYGESCYRAIVVEAPKVNHRLGKPMNGESRVGVAVERYHGFAANGTGERVWGPDVEQAFKIVSTWDEYEDAKRRRQDAHSAAIERAAKMTQDSLNRAGDLAAKLQKAGFTTKIERHTAFGNRMASVYEVVVTGEAE